MFAQPSINLEPTLFFFCRWGVPVPLGKYHVLQGDEIHSRSEGVPHRLIQDDVYNDYLLPRGASVFFNVWLVISRKGFMSKPNHLYRAITRNEEVYPEPEVFNPDRFSHSSSQEAREHVEAVWGFGRRICPGRSFAEGNLWLCIANFIATMDIEKAVDEDGSVINPAVAFATGAIR